MPETEVRQLLEAAYPYILRALDEAVFLLRNTGSREAEDACVDLMVRDLRLKPASPICDTELAPPGSARTP